MRRSNEVLLLIVGLVLSSACESSVVGGECRSGFEVCNGSCVDFDSNPEHCGGCGIMCSGTQWCSLGRCVANADGGLGDGATSTGDAGSSVADGSIPDGGPDAGEVITDCDIGERLCYDSCVTSATDPENCGQCGVACADDEYCSAGECVAECPAPSLVCDDRCVAAGRDAQNCGACGVNCADGICRHSACEERVPGHLVVIGHDYQNSRPAMRTLAGNAMFLSPVYRPHVLVYGEHSEPAAIVGTDAAVDEMAAASGRTLTRFLAPTGDDVPVLLADADVFVVYHQALADEEIIEQLSKRWRRPLLSFLQVGGVVVVFDGSSEHRGTHGVLWRTGLMLTDGWFDISNRGVELVQPSDALALGLPISYRGERTTVCFSMTGETHSVLARHGCPVVTHSVVLSP